MMAANKKSYIQLRMVLPPSANSSYNDLIAATLSVDPKFADITATDKSQQLPFVL
jgi:hypothetical protein